MIVTATSMYVTILPNTNRDVVIQDLDLYKKILDIKMFVVNTQRVSNAWNVKNIIIIIIIGFYYRSGRDFTAIKVHWYR